MAIKDAEPTAALAALAQTEGQRRPFTRQEYHAMVEAGILQEDSRVELIEGEIIEMSPINPPHAGTVAKLTEMLLVRLAGKAIVTSQNPFTIGDMSEPQPDVILARYRADYYSRAHPTPDVILLVVEVSQATLRYDRGRKVRLYGAAGLPEYWIVNLVDGTIEVYRTPTTQGYGNVTSCKRGDTLSPLAFPDLSLDVAAILPPAEEQ